MDVQPEVHSKEYKRDLLQEMTRTHDERGRPLPTHGRLILSLRNQEDLRAATRGTDKITSKFFKREKIHLSAWIHWQNALALGFHQATGMNDGFHLLLAATGRKIAEEPLLSITLKIARCAYGMGEGTEEYLFRFPAPDLLAQRMAEDILRESSYEFMPVLADLIEDTYEKCGHAPPESVLGHLRSGRHGPCCWVLRWILGVGKWREMCGRIKK